MIKYTLQCNNLHQFESWFRTSDDYEKLNNEKMLSCEICGSKSISKSLMSPSVSSKEKKRTKETLDTVPSKEQKLIKQLKKEVEKNDSASEIYGVSTGTSQVLEESGWDCNLSVACTRASDH